MEKKAANLKSIQNLDSQGNTKNPFNVLNNASINHLEFVASSCGITLGNHCSKSRDIITAMQA